MYGEGWEGQGEGSGCLRRAGRVRERAQDVWGGLRGSGRGLKVFGQG